jgi:hypothetical protein
MATRTLGTTAQNSLTALPFAFGYNSGMAAADIATINNAIAGPTETTFKEGARFTVEGVLYLPQKKGFIKLAPGDYVGVDANGWPVVVAAYAIAGAGWTHT